MATKAIGHACSGCGYVSPKWFGKCPDCGAWSTAVDPVAPTGGQLEVRALGAPGSEPQRFTTGSREVDRVLGGGLVPGSVVLLAGEPGIGKSTLVLQLLDGCARRDRPALLVTGEESLDQVSLRAGRLGVDPTGFLAAAGTSLASVLAACEAHQPGVLVVDSIQTLEDPELPQAPGSVTQVRDCAARLVRFAKATATTVVMVGHVTKDGTVAGPKTLEHMVDVVLTLEGERGGALRLLRGAKNRFGSCEETGVFAMGTTGLTAVPDPSAMLLADRGHDVPGSIVFPGMEGSRPLLIELQALVTKSKFPRRVAIGLDQRRVELLTGVMNERLSLELSESEIYASASGGLAIKEPAADLPIALSLWSAKRNVSLPSGMVAFGEIGLGGEVRRVPSAERRLSEAARLGFETAIVPRGVEGAPASLRVIEIEHLGRAGGLFEAVARR